MGSKYKLLIIMLITFVGYEHTHAQASASGGDNKVSLNIVLYPVQTLIVNAGQKKVDLEYRSVEDYKSGVINEQPDHLIICSTGGFEVSVETAETYFTGTHANIDVSDMKLTASRGSNNNLTEVDYAAGIFLSTLSAGLLRSKTGGIEQTFNIKYESAGDDLYINHFDTDDSPTIFTTIVTYSIVAQ